MASQKYRRILTIVIDSIGIGDAPDADKYNSDGADTLGHMAQWWVDNQGQIRYRCSETLSDVLLS